MCGCTDIATNKYTHGEQQELWTLEHNSRDNRKLFSKIKQRLTWQSSMCAVFRLEAEDFAREQNLNDSWVFSRDLLVQHQTNIVPSFSLTFLFRIDGIE